MKSKTNAVCYHLCNLEKKKKKNIRKQKQIHRHNKLVVKWGEEWEEGQDRDRRLRGTSYYADILYSIGNIANIL